MKDYLVVIGALVLFVIVFNSIQGSREEKINLRKLNEETANCEQHGGTLYIEPRKENVCVPKRKPESGK